MTYPKELYRGAESVIVQIDECTIAKHRPKKLYRVSQLDDKFTKQRAKSEAKILNYLAENGVAVPKLRNYDDETHTLTLSFVNGPQVKEILCESNGEELGHKIGELLAHIHSLGIAHADPTTSNMLFFDENVFLLDFGLSFYSKKDEDFAVDLHLLKQSLFSYHATIAENVFSAMSAAYKKKKENAIAVFERLANLEKRGRNKH